MLCGMKKPDRCGSSNPAITSRQSPLTTRPHPSRWRDLKQQARGGYHGKR